jgi:hypothetical protein
MLYPTELRALLVENYRQAAAGASALAHELKIGSRLAGYC